jgi:hypothetical protein
MKLPWQAANHRILIAEKLDDKKNTHSDAYLANEKKKCIKLEHPKKQLTHIIVLSPFLGTWLPSGNPAVHLISYLSR